MIDAEFGASCLDGTYALTFAARGGAAPLAGFGVLQFDGAGNLIGSVTESLPGLTYGVREIVTTPMAGTYAVEATGLGSVRLAGAEEPDMRLAVRDVGEIGERPVARELALVFRAVHERNGDLRVATGFRRPDGVGFDTRSLRGRYNGLAVGTGGETPVAGLGMLVYDGAGRFRETNVSNLRGDDFRARRFVPGSDQGAYTVAPDGTGTVADGGLLFAITRVRAEGGVALAEEYAFFVRGLVPTTGALVTGVTRRVCD
jgi:hypothetical protein